MTNNEKLDAQTEHERKLLLTTPITMDCFDIDFDSEEWKNYCMSEWKNLIEVLDSVRITARETNNAEIIRHFLKMLPNSYKVVKL